MARNSAYSLVTQEATPRNVWHGVARENAWLMDNQEKLVLREDVFMALRARGLFLCSLLDACAAGGQAGPVMGIRPLRRHTPPHQQATHR
ncbi:MAG: hypothetical protein RBR49_04340 [Desulfovibrio desulfuricans]|nr:hypothetical protein [Desulfovibrio desulfuricans]